MIVIESCPRCNGTPKVLKNIDWDSLIVDYYLMCSNCKLTTFGMFETEELAISAWNVLNEKEEKI